MDNKNKNHESGNGFLFGVLLGSLATLLFTTKRGREILKELTDKGVEKVSELEKRLKEVEVIEEVEENDYILPKARPVQTDEAEKNKFAEETSLPAAPDLEQLDKKEKVKLAKIEEKFQKPASVKKEQVQTPKPRHQVKRYFRKKS